MLSEDTNATDIRCCELPEISDRHYYLYAKGHYEKSDDVYEDLQKIQGAWCGCNPNIIRKWHIHQKLIELAFRTIQKSGNPFHQFFQFVGDIAPENRWKVNSFDKDWTTVPMDEREKIEIENYWTAVTKKCLSILCSVRVRNDHGEIILNLGKPDQAILPLKKAENPPEV